LSFLPSTGNIVMLLTVLLLVVS